MPYIPTTLLRWFTVLNRNIIKFDNCTDYRSIGKKWCATKITTSNRYVPGFWGECPDTLSCNGLKGKAKVFSVGVIFFANNILFYNYITL